MKHALKLCERIVLTDWIGHTKRVYFGRDRGITGFVGGFTFNLSKLNDEERQLITILATFGQHCGDDCLVKDWGK